jgi:hypothetical protein
MDTILQLCRTDAALVEQASTRYRAVEFWVRPGLGRFKVPLDYFFVLDRRVLGIRDSVRSRM